MVSSHIVSKFTNAEVVPESHIKHVQLQLHSYQKLGLHVVTPAHHGVPQFHIRRTLEAHPTFASPSDKTGLDRSGEIAANGSIWRH